MGAKRQFLVSTAVGLVALPQAGAAAPPLPPAPVAPLQYSWTGFYLGASAGYGWNDIPVGCSFTGSGSPCFNGGSPTLHMHGPLAGVEAGYNWQAGNWLLGLEADLSALDVSAVGHFSAADASYAGAQLASRHDWLGTVRGRVGFAVDRALFYGTGGFAYAGIRETYSDTVHGGGSWNATAHGWTAGGGVEYALSQNWSLKAEYLYVDLGSATTSITFSPGVVTTLRNKNDINIVRAGIDYRF